MSARAPGKERAVPNTRDLAAETYNRIVARRVRKRLDPEQGPVTDEQTRTRLENRMADLEKIHGQADFLPVRFLADGVARAQAVCRITTAGSWGTGFLIGRGLIMTNNQVLEDDVTGAG